MEEFKETFDAQLAPSSSGHVTSDPAISLDGGLIRVDGEIHVARNGTTAALIDTLVANKSLVSELSSKHANIIQNLWELKTGGRRDIPPLKLTLTRLPPTSVFTYKTDFSHPISVSTPYRRCWFDHSFIFVLLFFSLIVHVTSLTLSSSPATKMQAVRVRERERREKGGRTVARQRGSWSRQP